MMDQKLRKCFSDKMKLIIKLLRDDSSHQLVCYGPDNQRHVLKDYVISTVTISKHVARSPFS